MPTEIQCCQGTDRSVGWTDNCTGKYNGHSRMEARARSEIFNISWT